MSNSARFRAFSTTLFSKTAWIATVALVATLLVASPVSQTAAEATEAVIAPDSISVGYKHACAVVDGGVKCWGDNSDGQLSVDGIAASATAVQAIAADSGVVQVSAGGYHSCALFISGSIKCWGLNDDGQLGRRDNLVDSNEPSFVLVSNGQGGFGPLEGATQVSAGQYHTCAVVNRGVKCWGYNSDGQLGNGNNGTQFDVVAVIESGVPLTGVTQVSAGGYHTCAVVERGVKCWGSNSNGRLGTGNNDDSSQASSVVVRNDQDGLATIYGVSQVSAGENYTCAVSGTIVMCWGRNAYRQLGDGTTDDREVATAVASVENATQVSAGYGHTCAVVATGVKCWGLNENGQVGNGTMSTSENAVVAIAAGAAVLSIGTGYRFSCALLASEISCWGTNLLGQLGNGNVLSQATPSAVAGLEGATKLALGDEFSCALMVNTQVKCWGDNAAGQLGDGTVIDRSTPVSVLTAAGVALTGVTAITAGDSHACALVANGEVKCWGENNRAQLGNGSITDSLTPSSVLTEPGDALTGVTKIAAGSDHTCAIIDSTVKCWGSNGWKQIDASGVDREFATAVVGLPSETPVDITANFYTTCVVVDEGVACLGGNLGSGTGQELVAHLEIEDPTATAASLGDGFLCALIIESQVTCLGDNSDGQTGVSLRDDVTSPTTMSVFRGQIAIDAGDSHVCSLSGAGAVSCWGSNKFGQLGRSVEAGSTHIPAFVTGLGSGVTELAVAETEHSCAIVASVVKCWGSNGNGALGLPRIGRSATPITAAGVFGVIDNSGDDDGQGHQSSNVDHTSLLKPELVKTNRISVLKTGQRITLTGSNLSNVQAVLVGSKTATIVSILGSEIVIDVPADLAGSPQVTLVSKSGVQVIDGLIQIVKPYQARSVKVNSFKGNALTKDAAAVIRKSYLRDASVNIVSCAAVIGDGASAKTKAATIAKSLSACKAVSGYSVKFKTFKTVLRTLDAPLKTPFVTVTFGRSKPSLVN